MIHRPAAPRPRLLLPALLALAAACSGGSGAPDRRTESSEEAGHADVAADASAPMSSLGSEHGVAQSGTRRAEPPRDGAAASPNAAAPDTTAAAAVLPTMLIRTGQAEVRVDSLEAGVAAVRAMATRLGGFVANTELQVGAEQSRRASLELRIPAARFDEAVAGLNPLGTVERVIVRAEDVGEEYTDVSARVANSRRLETRLVELLATRTGKLEDVLAVERELARVREEIERREGRLRYLRTRAAVSTLTVVVHEPGPIVGDYPGQNPVARAFRDAWRNFVAFVAGFIAALGYLVPLGLLLWIAWLVLRRFRPRGDDGPTRLGIRRPRKPQIRVEE